MGEDTGSGTRPGGVQGSKVRVTQGGDIHQGDKNVGSQRRIAFVSGFRDSRFCYCSSANGKPSNPKTAHESNAERVPWTYARAT